ncbi:MAG: hypothetical protein WBA45_16680 [Microthrixaceae bacterium]
MSDPNFPPPPPGGTPPPPPPPPGGMPPSPPPPPGGGGFGAPPPPGGTPPPPGGFGAPPPPPGGFGGPPGGFTPPPAQPYGGGSERPQLDVGSSLSYGWKKFSENAGQFIVMMLAVVVITIAAAFASAILSTSGTSEFTGSGFEIGRVSFGGLIWNLIVTLVFYSIIFVIQAGVWRAGLGVTKGQTPSISQLTETSNFGQYAMTSILVFVVPNLISSVLGWISGFLALIFFLPFIAWVIATAFAPLIALDKGLGPIEAISQSVTWVKDNLGATLAILIVSYIVYVVGVCACGVGWLATGPIAIVSISYAYRALNNEMVTP